MVLRGQLLLLSLAFLSPPLVAADSWPTFEDVVAGSPAGLTFRNQEVQNELGLSLDDVRKVWATALKPLSDEYDSKVKQLPPTAFADRQAVHAPIATEFRKRADESVVKLLTKSQATRLAQIDIQLRGPAAFRDETVMKRLEMSKEQRQQVQELLDEFDRKQSRMTRESRGVGTKKLIPDTNIPQAGQISGLEFMTPKQLQQETYLKLTNLLTPKQQTVWAEIRGEPFPKKTR